MENITPSMIHDEIMRINNTKFCEHCQSLCTSEFGEKINAHYCTNDKCNYIFYECLYHDPVLKKAKMANGEWMAKRQCNNCGKVYPREKYTGDFLLLQEVDFDFERRVLKWETQQRIAYRQEVENKKRDDFLMEHAKYLRSDKWKQKRQKVLERDNYTCQACLSNKATEVHHLTYEHWQDEFMFELTSVCGPCHKLIHNK
jgi:5-methylcytosine-specific restriction endonuclease McrA